MEKKVYDTLILGAGPAGLSAGLYASRAGLSVLLIEKGVDGGQIILAHDIQNYPGQARIDGEPGTELIASMSAQCRKFGCERVSDTVSSCDLSGEIKLLRGARGEYRGYSVILCTGAMTRAIGCRNEAKYVGRGVSYCAVCDGSFFTDLDIYAVGGNSIAAEEALYLSRFGRTVTLLCKGEALTVSPALKKELAENEKLRVLTETEVVELAGETVLDTLVIRNTRTGEETTLRADPADGIFGLFCFTGKKTTGMFEGLLDREENTGYLRTNEKMETNIPGVYAAGDVRTTPLRQVVTACADGAVAATQCEKYVAKYKKEHGL